MTLQSAPSGCEILAPQLGRGLRELREYAS